MKKKSTALILSAFMAIGLTALMTGCGNKAETVTDETTIAEATADETTIAEATADGTVKVSCINGVMLGKTENGVTAFKGIPYAKPPVDELRWKAPEAPDKSNEEIECFEFGDTALQYEWPSEPASSTKKSEDCLSLNIWEKEGTAESGETKPVMVFFHGGAYGWGGTKDPMYDGENFIEAHDDVILVTCNYRLGLMAWADFSKIEGGEEYTDINLGLRDQIAALTWIKENIAGFGGDPDNVTIFGESAGAWSTTGLMISPKAKGLFKRVIAESGIVPPKDREAAQEFAAYIMEAADAENMDDLLAISADKWMELDGTEWIADECCGVVVDDDIIPADMDSAIADAAKSGVELLIGTNKDEWNYFQDDSEGDTEEEKFASWNEGMDDMIAEIKESSTADGEAALNELYDYEAENVPEEYAEDEKKKDALAKSAIITEAWRYEHFVFLDKFVDAGGKAYMYRWDVPSTLDSMYKSAVHAIELAYVFNNTDDEIYAGKVDKDIAAKTQSAWINFAASGDPSIDGAEWTSYDTTDRNTMVITNEGWDMQSDPSKIPRELFVRICGDEPYQVW